MAVHQLLFELFLGWFHRIEPYLWAYQNMLYGDATATAFGGPSGNDPDWFKLTATGKNANGQTVGTAEFYLADYRFSNNNEDYVLNTWEWFDLSTLGEVATISFSLSSSKNDSYGMITPAYFCMDDFNGVGPNTPDLPPYIAHPVDDIVMNEFPMTVEVNLEGVATDPDDDDDQIAYALVSNSNTTDLSAHVNGKMLVLERVENTQAEATLVLRATSDGQSVDFNVHVVLNEFVGIEENTVAVEVYPNPARDFVRIEGMEAAKVQVYNALGQLVKTVQGSNEINVSDFAEGIYLLHITEAAGRSHAARVVVK